jgi:hypothetical protein
VTHVMNDGSVMAVRQAGAAGATVSRILREPFTRRARAELAYAIISGPLAIVGFAVTAGTLLAGAGLSLTVGGMLVGVPLIAASVFAVRWLGSVSRGIARRLLGQWVPAPPPLHAQPGLTGWLRSTLGDAPGWRARGYLVVKLPVGLFGLLVAGWFWLGGLAYLTYPVWWEVLHRVPITVDGVRQPDPVTNPGPIGAASNAAAPTGMSRKEPGRVSTWTAPMGDARGCRS